MRPGRMVRFREWCCRKFGHRWRALPPESCGMWPLDECSRCGRIERATVYDVQVRGRR